MLPELQAERQLLAIEAASVPHMTQQSRLDVLTRWARRGQPKQARPALTKDEMHAALAASGIPIVHVTKKKRRR